MLFEAGGKSRLLVGEMQSGWNGKINDYMQLNYKLLVKFETTISKVVGCRGF